jgi:phage shock protein PspC (stress-responsive transcriptional regulator)
VFTWWSNQDPLLVRISAVVAVIFGAFVVYVLSHGQRGAA